MKKKTMTTALCYHPANDPSKSYLYSVGNREMLEKMMNDWNTNGNPDPCYPSAGKGAVYYLDMVEDDWN